jgi:carbon monoxide dehydrogenase subunit G
MGERTSGQIEIEASPAEVMEVIEDFESYPEWAEIKEVEVLTRDDEGRGREVAMEVEVPVAGRARYTLTYEYEPGHGGVRWTTKEAEGFVKDLRGRYALEDRDGDTRVTYDLEIEVGVPLPGFMKRRADRRIVDTALNGLKKRVEEG